MNKERNKTWSDVLEVISYIMWSISVWCLCYFQQNNVDYKSDQYRVVAWLYMLSGFLFYKDSYREVTKEIVKSFVIVFTTTIYQSILENKFDINYLVVCLTMQVVLQCVAYIFVWIIKKSKELHGDKTLLLQTIFMIAFFIPLFLFRTKIEYAIVIAIFIDFCLGYSIHKRKLKNDNLIEQQKIEEEKKKKKNEMEIETNKMKAERYDRLVELENKAKKKEKINQYRHNKRSKSRNK